MQCKTSLTVQTGRFMVSEVQMLYLKCDLGKTEDEINFRFYCQLYKVLRTTVLKMSLICEWVLLNE